MISFKGGQYTDFTFVWSPAYFFNFKELKVLDHRHLIGYSERLVSEKNFNILFFSLSLSFDQDVRKGIYMGRKVAIKQLKDNMEAAQTFLAEASVMT